MKSCTVLNAFLIKYELRMNSLWIALLLLHWSQDFNKWSHELLTHSKFQYFRFVIQMEHSDNLHIKLIFSFTFKYRYNHFLCAFFKIEGWWRGMHNVKVIFLLNKTIIKIAMVALLKFLCHSVFTKYSGVINDIRKKTNFQLQSALHTVVCEGLQLENFITVDIVYSQWNKNDSWMWLLSLPLLK